MGQIVGRMKYQLPLLLHAWEPIFISIPPSWSFSFPEATFSSLMCPSLPSAQPPVLPWLQHSSVAQKSKQLPAPHLSFLLYCIFSGLLPLLGPMSLITLPYLASWALFFFSPRLLPVVAVGADSRHGRLQHHNRLHQVCHRPSTPPWGLEPFITSNLTRTITTYTPIPSVQWTSEETDLDL